MLRQWPEVRRTKQNFFAGYRPGSQPFNPASFTMNPNFVRRMQASAMADPHNALGGDRRMLDFGFFPRELDLRTGDIAITTLAEFDETVRLVRESPCVDGSWFYAPRQQARDMFKRTITTKPYSARVFGLRKTHRIEHKGSQDPHRLRFLMHCFGFFEGMRMDDTGAGFLDATPVEPGTLTDFTFHDDDSLGTALNLADQFWVRHETGRAPTGVDFGTVDSHHLTVEDLASDKSRTDRD